jgi:hypothetical protein
VRSAARCSTLLPWYGILTDTFALTSLRVFAKQVRSHRDTGWLPFPVSRRNPCRAASGSRDDAMLDKLGNNAASKKFVKAYDKYTLALCGTALVAYGMQQYFVRVSPPGNPLLEPSPRGDREPLAPRTAPHADPPSANLSLADARPRVGTTPPRRSPRKCPSRKRKRVGLSDAKETEGRERNAPVVDAVRRRRDKNTRRLRTLREKTREKKQKESSLCPSAGLKHNRVLDSLPKHPRASSLQNTRKTKAKRFFFFHANTRRLWSAHPAKTLRASSPNAKESTVFGACHCLTTSQSFFTARTLNSTPLPSAR